MRWKKKVTDHEVLRLGGLQKGYRVPIKGLRKAECPSRLTESATDSNLSPNRCPSFGIRFAWFKKVLALNLEGFYLARFVLEERFLCFSHFEWIFCLFYIHIQYIYRRKIYCWDDNHFHVQANQWNCKLVQNFYVTLVDNANHCFCFFGLSWVRSSSIARGGGGG